MMLRTTPHMKAFSRAYYGPRAFAAGIVAILITTQNCFAFDFKKLQELNNKQKCQLGITTRIENINKDKSTVDVSSEVDALEATVRECNLSLTNFGVVQSDLTSWKNQGYQAEFQAAQHDLEAAKYVRPDPVAAARMKKFGRLLGMGSKELDAIAEKSQTSAMSVRNQEKEDCQPAVDFHQKFGPQRNQGTVPSCYSFAAADLLSAKMGKRISALDLALANMKDELKKTPANVEFGLSTMPQKGHIKKAIDEAMKRGFCLESDLPSEDNGVNSLLSVFESLNRLKQSDGARVNNQLCDKEYQAMRAAFPNVKFDDFKTIIKTASVNHLLEILSEKTCPNRLKVKFQVTTESANSATDKTNLFKTINRQLNSGEASAVDINDDIYYDSKSRARNANHSSVIVGRRYDPWTQQCLYRVRNSWGGNSQGFDSRIKTEDGDIWIPKALFWKSIENVTTLH